MHRLIIDCPVNMQTDHINGNGLDNRKSNLRVCYNYQNARNQKLRPNSNSGFKGVSLIKDRNKWVAQIKVNGKVKYLGAYTLKEEAARAYNKAAKELFGEFAWLNKLKNA